MAKKRKKATGSRRQAGNAAPELVTWAMHGIQQAIDAARARLEDLEAQARKLRGATRAVAAAAAGTFSGAKDDDAAAAPASATRGKRTLSPEARNRISEAQKRRWAKARKGTRGTKATRTAKAAKPTTEA